MMKKKILCLALIFSLMFGLSGCSGKSKYILQFDEIGISGGVFAYYVNKITASPKSYNVKDGDSKAIIEKATELCAEAAAAKKLMQENPVSLQLQYKTDVAQETENIWNLFGDYYKSIGVSKPDITAVNTFEAEKKQLVQYFYGTGSKKPVSDDDLKQKFVEMYIGFKGFEGSFTKLNAKGETVEMTESEKEKTIEDFRSMANKINDGADIDDVYSEYCTKQGLVATTELQVNLFKDKDPMYADDFFKKVSTISHGKAAPVTSGSSVYVVQRTTIASSDEDAFEAYREEVLDEMKMPAVEKMIAKKVKALEVQKQDKRLERVYKALGIRQ